MERPQICGSRALRPFFSVFQRFASHCVRNKALMGSKKEKMEKKEKVRDRDRTGHLFMQMHER